MVDRSAALVFEHWNQVPEDKKIWPWPHFTPKELACSCCDGLIIVPEALDRLQAGRFLYGRGIYVASAYRCVKRNTELGGAENSAHPRGTAFDPYLPAVGNLAQFQNAMNAVGPWMGRGSGAGKMHLDFDRELGERAWFYGTSTEHHG